MRIYVAYSVFYSIGTILAMLIPFVNHAAVRSSEHLASHCVFVLMNCYVVIEYMRKVLPQEQVKQLISFFMALATTGFFLVFVFVSVSGVTRWSGRSMTLLDPTYAKKYIPIIASVSEHQPTSWSSYFFDLQHLMIFMPVGFYFCINKELTYGKLFIAIYGVLATYFSCVMIRLMLVLAPAACILAGIGISEMFRVASKSIREWMMNERRFQQEVIDEVNKKKPAKGKGKQ